MGPFVPETPASNKALVVGSSGTLGRAVVQHLRHQQKMTVLEADIVHNEGSTSSEHFCDLSSSSNLPELTVNLTKAVNRFVGDEKLDVVVCAAGGWAGNPPVALMDSLTLEQQAQEYAETVDHMRQVNLDPVIATSFLLSQFMARDSLVVMIGATAALQPTPDMMAYGLSKAAVHFCVQTLGAATTRSLDLKSVRQRSNAVLPVTVVGILPNVLDTPGNRKAMTYSSTWTAPKVIADQIGEWIRTPGLRPHSGALVKVQTNTKGESALTIVA